MVTKTKKNEEVEVENSAEAEVSDTEQSAKEPAKKATKKTAAKTTTKTTRTRKTTTSRKTKKASTAKTTKAAKATEASDSGENVENTNAEDSTKSTSATKKTTKATRTTRKKAATKKSDIEDAPSTTSASSAKSKTTKTLKKTTRKKTAEIAEDNTKDDASVNADAPVRETQDAQEPKSSSNNQSDDQQQNEANQQIDENQENQNQDANQENTGKKNGKNKRKTRRRNKNKDARHLMSREDLSQLETQDLIERANDLKIDIQSITNLTKEEFIDLLYDETYKAQGCKPAAGVLDIMVDGYGFLRSSTYLPGEGDTYVGAALIRRHALRKGDYIEGVVRSIKENEKFAPIQLIEKVNGVDVNDVRNRAKFAKLTPIYPDERLVLEHGKNTTTARMIDLVSPIGKGQRGLIVSPPKAGKTTVLKDIAASITANNPEVHLMCLLIDERPEEVTDMERSINGEVVSSTFDMPCEHHIAVAELVIERAKRLVEIGRDVVILLDSLTRLARAYNLSQPASGRVLSGGVDSTALYPPKKFLGAARNIEGGGSLTILASALIETGSKMDEVIFEEFKGTGNMELKLDRYLADRRIFPAIDAVASGTRKEDLLLNPQEAPLIWAVRRLLANMNNTERSTNMLVQSLRKTESNQEFLIRAAKKAQAKGKLDEL